MDFSQSLYEGKHICFAPIDHERDAIIESQWTHDLEYLRLLDTDIARPLSPEQLKKRYDEIEKDVDEKRTLFYFTVRKRSDDSLVGFARIFWIAWSNGYGYLQLGIGDPQERHKGYGTEVLQLLLQYAFDELSLHRVAAILPEYNLGALRLFEKAGFVQEARRRQALNRGGRRWDVIHLALLEQEWRQARSEEN